MPTLTQKAQVTVPKEIRNFLGVRPGDEVEFVVQRKEVIVHKKAKKLPFHKWRGYLGQWKTDTLMEELR